MKTLPHENHVFEGSKGPKIDQKASQMDAKHVIYKVDDNVYKLWRIRSELGGLGPESSGRGRCGERTGGGPAIRGARVLAWFCSKTVFSPEEWYKIGECGQTGVLEIRINSYH